MVISRPPISLTRTLVHQQWDSLWSGCPSIRGMVSLSIQWWWNGFTSLSDQAHPCLTRILITDLLLPDCSRVVDWKWSSCWMDAGVARLIFQDGSNLDCHHCQLDSLAGHSQWLIGTLHPVSQKQSDPHYPPFLPLKSCSPEYFALPLKNILFGDVLVHSSISWIKVRVTFV